MSKRKWKGDFPDLAKAFFPLKERMAAIHKKYMIRTSCPTLSLFLLVNK